MENKTENKTDGLSDSLRLTILNDAYRELRAIISGQQRELDAIKRYFGIRVEHNSATVVLDRKI